MPRLFSGVVQAAALAIASVSPVLADVAPPAAASRVSQETFSRVVASPLFTGQSQRMAYSVGSPVAVFWGGRWYPAMVRAVIGPGQWLITYIGYSSSWDEVVGSNRIRWRQSPVPSAPSAQPNNAGGAAPCGFGSKCGAVPLNANPTGLFGTGTW